MYSSMLVGTFATLLHGRRAGSRWHRTVHSYTVDRFRQIADSPTMSLTRLFSSPTVARLHGSVPPGGRQFKEGEGEGWRSLRDYPSWDEEEIPEGQSANGNRPPKNVTNHVGNIGVMSDALRRRSKEEMEEAVREAQREREKARAKHRVGRPFGTPHHHHSPGIGVEEGAAIQSSSTVSLVSPATSLPEHVRGPTRSPPRNRLASAKYSGAQREVLHLYRCFLKTFPRFMDEATRRRLQRYVREEFDKGVALERRQLDAVEWRINYGKRKLEELEQLARGQGGSATFRFVH